MSADSSPSWTPTPTPSAPRSCAGDCNGDQQVAINELLAIIDVALGQAPVSMCEAADVDGNGGITVDEILAAVNSALNGCGRLTAPCSVDASKTFQDCHPALAAEPIRKTVQFVTAALRWHRNVSRGPVAIRRSSWMCRRPLSDGQTCMFRTAACAICATRAERQRRP